MNELDTCIEQLSPARRESIRNLLDYIEPALAIVCDAHRRAPGIWSSDVVEEFVEQLEGHARAFIAAGIPRLNIRNLLIALARQIGRDQIAFGQLYLQYGRALRAEHYDRAVSGDEYVKAAADAVDRAAQELADAQIELRRRMRWGRVEKLIELRQKVGGEIGEGDIVQLLQLIDAESQ